jgi:hypothetical protein
LKLLNGKVREMAADIRIFKAAVSAAAPSDSSAPLALRLGNVDSSARRFCGACRRRGSSCHSFGRPRRRRSRS